MRMRILLLFFVISIIMCDQVSELPMHLKCADKSCVENISVGRILKHSDVFFGDLKHIKKSTKVNIKGKNVDDKNSLWLIEFDGSKGFVDFSLIKENSNTVVNDLEVVNNPFYVTTNNVIDETEDTEDLGKPTLFSSREDLKENNIVKDETEEIDSGKTDNSEDVSKANFKESILTKSNEINESLNQVIKHDIYSIKKDKSQKYEEKINQKDGDLSDDDALKNQIREKQVNKDHLLDGNSDEQNKVKDISENEKSMIKVNDSKILKNLESQGLINITNLKDENSINKITPHEITDTVKEQIEHEITVNLKDEMKHENLKVINRTSNVQNDNLSINENLHSRKNLTETTSEMNLKDDLTSKSIKPIKDEEEDKSALLSNNSSILDLKQENTISKDTPEMLTPRSDVQIKKTDSVNKEKLKDDYVLQNNVPNKEDYSKDTNKKISKQIILKNQEIKSKLNDKELQDKMTQKSDINERLPDKDGMNSATKDAINVIDINNNASNNETDGESYTKHNKTQFELNKNLTDRKKMDVETNRENDINGTDTETAKDSDPWLVNSGDKCSRLNVRSPFLKLILYIETKLHSPIHMIIKKTSLDSSIYFSKFVHNVLGVSVENFVLILSLFLTIVIIVYTPKMFGWSRDWKLEFEKQSQLIVELESRLSIIEDVRQKLTVQNKNFEKVIDEYKARVNDIQEDASNKKKTIMADLDRMKKTNEIKIQILSKDLDKSMEKCKLLEEDISEKEATIEYLNEEKTKIEREFTTELQLAKDSVQSLKEKLLQMEDLKKKLNLTLKENNKFIEQIDNISGILKMKDEEINKLKCCLEELKMCEGLEEKECNEKIMQCLETHEVKKKLFEVEKELNGLKKEFELSIIQIKNLEDTNQDLKQKSLEYEQQRSSAVKDQESAELKLQVLTDYFHQKEIEMQKSLGHESVEKSLSVGQLENYKNKIENLEDENLSMSKTIQKLKNEVKDSQAFAVKCKNDANTQNATQFVTISNLERELMIEREESKKLRQKLSYYIGPNQPRNNMSSQNNERPTSRQSAVSEMDRVVSQPPIFPLGLLPQPIAIRPQYSGRSSANSVSKKSNNS